MWNKVYSRDFLLNNNICFPRLLIQQDEVFNLRVYRHVHRTLISPQVLYHYYVYDKGNTRSRFISDRFEIYNAVKDEFLDLYKEWSLHDERMLKYVYNRFFSSIVIALNSLLSTDLWVKHRNENRLRMASILCCEETIDCISNMLSLNIIPKSFIQHLYFKAIKRNNLFFYRVVFILDHFVQSIKWEVRKRL